MGKDKTHLDKTFVRKLYGVAAAEMPDPENKYEPPMRRASGKTLAFLRNLGPDYSYELPDEVKDKILTAENETGIPVISSPKKPATQEAAVKPDGNEPVEKVEGTFGKIGGAMKDGLKKVLGIGGDKPAESKESATE